MHKAVIFVYFLAAASLTHIRKSTADQSDTEKLDLNGETAYENFIKVLAGVLITVPEPPRDVISAVKVVMRDLMNGEPAKQGYFSYLTTSSLRFYNSPLKIQVDNMFNIIIMMSDPNSPMAKSSKIVQDFMLSPEGFLAYKDIEKYVTNLFQPIVTTPASSMSINLDSLQRPANGVRRPSSRQ